jgi:hypothetical protein
VDIATNTPFTEFYNLDHPFPLYELSHHDSTDVCVAYKPISEVVSIADNIRHSCFKYNADIVTWRFVSWGKVYIFFADYE